MIQGQCSQTIEINVFETDIAWL